MGLLDRALRERPDPRSGQGGGPPREAAVSRDEGQPAVLGLAALAELGLEIAALPPGPDRVFLAYASLAEALPLGGLALYASVGSRSRLLAATRADFPEIAALPGPAEPPAFRKPSGAPDETLPFRVLALSPSPRGPAPVWAVMDPALEDPDFSSALASLLSTASADCPALVLPDAFEAADAKAALGTGKPFALLLLDGAIPFQASQPWIPGLRPEGYRAFLAASLSLLLAGAPEAPALIRARGASGLVAAAPWSAGDAFDEGLFLCQLGKSLRRSSPLPMPLPERDGRVAAFDPRDPGALASVLDFAAE